MNMFRKVKFLLPFLFLDSVCGFTVPFEGLFRLDLIHYNDFHARFVPNCLHRFTLLEGRYEESSLNAIKCHSNNNSCLGGFSRLYQEIKVLLQEKPDSLLLNAGDSFQGTYWYTLLKWNVTQEFMNLIPHDAHAIGNHDFDNGPEGLAPYLAALKAPALAANMDTAREPSLHGLYQPHVVVERNGRKIGIIGLITADTDILSSLGNVVITDPHEATRREVQALTERGVDIIILLSHCGLDVDKELARNFGQYVDVIVGGHSHRDAIVVPYPVLIESSDYHKVVIVQAYSFTKFVGNLSMYFDFRGDYVSWDGNLIFLNSSIPEDNEIKAKLEPYAILVHEAENTQIGETLTAMAHEDCAYGECALGDMLVDAFNVHAIASVPSQYDYISFVQRSQLQITIPQGPITRGTIVQLLPYYDKILTFELLGIHIVEVLEKGVSDAESYQPFKGPWVLQVSGLRVSYNVSNPEGSRVSSVFVGNIPLDRGCYYQVTVPLYIAIGQEGFEPFVRSRRNVQQLDYDQHVVEKYVRTHSPLNFTVDHRIVINT